LILANYRFLHQKLFVTRFQKRKMPPFATIRMKLSDRRDEMVLGMARDAARVKGKAREACRKKARQSWYRQVRYQRFQCRREEVFEEESRARYRVRRERSIIIIASWLEAQAKVNAEEGKPRSEETEGAGSSEAAAVEVVPMVMALLVEGPINAGEPVMEATVVGKAPLSVAVASAVGERPLVAVNALVGKNEQSLITSFFTRG
jgi:hypothetical protein